MRIHFCGGVCAAPALACAFVANSAQAQKCDPDKPLIDPEGGCWDICPAEYPLLNGNACVAACPTDKPLTNEGSCVAGCPQGREAVSGTCYAVCEEGQTRLTKVIGVGAPDDTGCDAEDAAEILQDCEFLCWSIPFARATVRGMIGLRCRITRPCGETTGRQPSGSHPETSFLALEYPLCEGNCARNDRVAMPKDSFCGGLTGRDEPGASGRHWESHGLCKSLFPSPARRSRCVAIACRVDARNPECFWHCSWSISLRATVRGIIRLRCRITRPCGETTGRQPSGSHPETSFLALEYPLCEGNCARNDRVAMPKDSFCGGLTGRDEPGASGRHWESHGLSKSLFPSPARRSRCVAIACRVDARNPECFWHCSWSISLRGNCARNNQVAMPNNSALRGNDWQAA